MKTKNLITKALLTIVGTGLIGVAAQAATPTYTSDDLFLAVRATGGTGASKDYLVNIGQASIYRNATTSFAVGGLGNISADLVDVFGANWATRTDLLWSVSGGTTTQAVGSDPRRTVYATRMTGAQAWTADNFTGLADPAGQISNVGAGFVSPNSGIDPNSTTSHSNVAVIQNTSDINSYASFQDANSYGYFPGRIEGGSDTGITTVTLELYRLTAVDRADPISGAAGTRSIGDVIPSEGTFSLGSDGTLTFSSATPVPEPAVTGALAAVVAGLAIAMRRRKVAAQA